jgi:hypothetical protein
MNDHWNVLYQVTVFYADRKSKMAAFAGHRLTLDRRQVMAIGELKRSKYKYQFLFLAKNNFFLD